MFAVSTASYADLKVVAPHHMRINLIIVGRHDLRHFVPLLSRSSLPITANVARLTCYEIPMPDWLDYQELVAAIYRDISPNAVVTHNDSILSLESRTKRQIDVSIRADLGGHGLLIIVQAKHLNRPADVNVVGEFNAVIEDVRASKGVLICSAGFTATALAYANNKNIDLCTAHDATSRNWALDLRIPLLWIEPSIDFLIELELMPKETNTEPLEVDGDFGKWLLSRDGGATVQSIAQVLCERWNEPDTPHTPGEQHRLEIPCNGIELLFGKTYWCPLVSLAYVYTIGKSGWRGTFTFAQCRGILNVATGTLRSKVRLTDKDIPIQRDPSWKSIDDLAAFEAANADLMRIEKSAPSSENFSPENFSPENLVKSWMQFERG